MKYKYQGWTPINFLENVIFYKIRIGADQFLRGGYDNLSIRLNWPNSVYILICTLALLVVKTCFWWIYINRAFNAYKLDLNLVKLSICNVFEQLNILNSILFLQPLSPLSRTKIKGGEGVKKNYLSLIILSNEPIYIEGPIWEADFCAEFEEVLGILGKYTRVCSYIYASGACANRR